MESSVETWNGVWAHVASGIPHDTVLDKIAALGARSILEVGAGTGEDLFELQARAYDVAFVDFSEEAARHFSARCPAARVVLSDARRLPFNDDTFDLVYSLGLVEHFEADSREQLLREQFRVTRSYVLVDVPQKLSLAFPVKRALMALGRWRYGEEVEFTYAALRQEVLRAWPQAELVGSYGRELIPLPRRVKQYAYRLLPAPARRGYVATHRWFARAMAGSFGLVFAKHHAPVTG